METPQPHHLKNNPEVFQSILENLKIAHPEIFRFISDSYNPTKELILNKQGEIETEEGTYANNPKMQELVRIAAAIKDKLPQVEQGHTRLWRGNRTGEVGKNPSYTNSLIGIALPFLLGYKGPLSYVDVPSEIIEQSLRTSGVAKDSEFILPKEILSEINIVGLDKNEQLLLISNSNYQESSSPKNGWGIPNA